MQLKDVFSKDFFNNFFRLFSEVYPLDTQKCSKLIFTNEWESLELKQRMSHVAKSVHACLPNDYEKNLDYFITFLANNSSTFTSQWLLAYMFIPEYIQCFGINKPDSSLPAIKEITKYTSCEFVIRDFLLSNSQNSMSYMLELSNHTHENVRRFASEGCRPRLPWAKKLPFLIKNPEPIFPILENLINDSSDFVLKSVANNLNDISKDHPKLALDFARKYINKTDKINKVLKHGLRTLLKAGNVEALQMFNLNDSVKVRCEMVSYVKEVSDKTPLQFTIKLLNLETVKSDIRVEYALYFLRQNNKYSKKVFFIHQKEYDCNKEYIFEKQYSFKPITTRRYYSGLHYFTIIVNGVEYKKNEFILTI